MEARTSINFNAVELSARNSGLVRRLPRKIEECSSGEDCAQRRPSVCQSESRSESLTWSVEAAHPSVKRIKVLVSHRSGLTPCHCGPMFHSRVRQSCDTPRQIFVVSTAAD